MSTTTVRQVITDSINARGLGTHLRDAEPVIADVEAAAQNVVASLINVAVSRGLSEREATEALIQAGLVQRPTPEPAATVTGSEGATEDRLASLESQVNRLVALAERHLGRV